MLGPCSNHHEIVRKACDNHAPTVRKLGQTLPKHHRNRAKPISVKHIIVENAKIFGILWTQEGRNVFYNHFFSLILSEIFRTVPLRQYCAFSPPSQFLSFPFIFSYNTQTNSSPPRIEGYNSTADYETNALILALHLPPIALSPGFLAAIANAFHRGCPVPCAR